MKTQTSECSKLKSQRKGARRWLAGLCALGATLGTALAIGAPTPVVATEHTAYLPGEPIVATFANGPGNPKDWIGVYMEGQTPGNIGSTLWNYVNNSQTAGAGLTEGQVTFPAGLNLAGNWVVYLLLNDGYTKLATNTFQVIDPSAPVARTDKRRYAPGEAITVAFTNAPANPKDWVGIYPEGKVPGSVASTLWLYVDGTQTGATGKSEGTVRFAGGLASAGKWVAYLLENDGYTVLASEPFVVAQPPAPGPQLLSIFPRDGAKDLPPVVDFFATITNGLTRLDPNSVVLSIDDLKVTHLYQEQAGLVSIAYTNETLLASNSVHTYRLTFADNAQPANHATNQGAFTVVGYQNVVLPPPLYFENFDATAEGQLPAGWTRTNFTDVSGSDSAVDFGNLDSAAFEGWTVVDAFRFQNAFVTYSRPDNMTFDYLRVVSVNPRNVENGKFLRHLATGRMAFGDSGYRNGRSQVTYLFTPDFDLRGKSNVFLSFHSLWEQNQDSMAAVEYSVDQGAHWLPIVYMLDDQGQTADVVRFPEGGIDAVTTLTNVHPDVAVYTDPVTGQDVGGFYGAFIGAPISQDLAPYISGRINDDPVESKRVELFRLPKADGQAQVRFRFAHAGTDSWYFGIDDFGLYSITGDALKMSVSLQGTTLTFSWSGRTGPYQLQKTTTLTNPLWQNVGNPIATTSTTDTLAAGTAFYRVMGQ